MRTSWLWQTVHSEVGIDCPYEGTHGGEAAHVRAVWQSECRLRTRGILPSWHGCSHSVIRAPSRDTEGYTRASDPTNAPMPTAKRPLPGERRWTVIKITTLEQLNKQQQRRMQNCLILKRPNKKQISQTTHHLKTLQTLLPNALCQCLQLVTYHLFLTLTCTDKHQTMAIYLRMAHCLLTCAVLTTHNTLRAHLPAWTRHHLQATPAPLTTDPQWHLTQPRTAHPSLLNRQQTAQPAEAALHIWQL